MDADKTNSLWGVAALVKLRDALDFLHGSEKAPRVLFMPDVVRDGMIIVPEGKDITEDLDPESAKNRIRDYIIFSKGGGHALIAAYAAAVLREKRDARIALAASIFPRDRDELVGSYMTENPRSMGASPIDSSMVFVDKASDSEDSSSLNIVVEREGKTTIATGKNPVLKLSDLAESDRKDLMGEMRKADVVAALSVKAPSFKETLTAMMEGKLAVHELVSDLTSGDDMAANQKVLDILGIKNRDGRSPIGLLSINSDEACVYAELLMVEKIKKGEISPGGEHPITNQKLSGHQISGKPPQFNTFEDQARLDAELLEEVKPKNGFEAAKYLNEMLGVPLLYHSQDGACILDHYGGKATRFVPSVKLRETPDNFVGAGDTLCGGMALALAVKRRLEDPAIKAPAYLRLSYEECLLIASFVTCYRLEQVAILSKQKKPHSWRISVGSISQLIEWAKDAEFNKAEEVSGDLVAEVTAGDLPKSTSGQQLKPELIHLARSRHHYDADARPLSLDEVMDRVHSFVQDPGSPPSLAFLDKLKTIRISDQDCKLLVTKVIVNYIGEHGEAVGKIIGALGRHAVRFIPEALKGGNYSAIKQAARAAGKPLLDEIRRILRSERETIIVSPWESELNDLIRLAGDVGNRDTARALAFVLPTEPLLVPPSGYSPACNAVFAITDIADRLKLADPEVAQALYEAEVANSTENGLSLATLLLCAALDYNVGASPSGVRTFGGYDPDSFYLAARNARKAIQRHIEQNDIAFSLQEPKVKPKWSSKGLELVFRLGKTADNKLTAQDIQELQEKGSSLCRRQARLLANHPSLVKLLDKHATMEEVRTLMRRKS